MAALKGRAGYSVIGDKSAEFYKDPIAFVNWRIKEYNSRVFLSRLLNKPTVFVGTINGVKELTGAKNCHFDMGYRAFLQPVFGNNIMFETPAEAARLHQVIHRLYGAQTVPSVKNLIQRLTEKHFSNLDKSHCVSVYTLFKRFATEFSLELFLGLDAEKHPDLTESIIDVTTTHWHGIISVPLTVKMSMFSSSYSRALEAKDKLLGIIRDKLAHTKDGSSLQSLTEAGFQTAEELEQHTLLFTSALVPKAIASMLTSFLIATGGSEKEILRQQAAEDADCLNHILLEVERLWPPILGGRRLTLEDCVIDGFKIPKGYAVVYITHAAHRDPTIFPQPETFKPERWKDRTSEASNLLFTFGGGVRSCVGTALMKTSLQTVCRYLVEHYNWRIPAGQDLSYKWLPVSRPKDNTVASFTPRLPQETSTTNST
ncbi:putative cytochrome P450 120 [Asterias rubens]|uniref:putative cytochrome P450 120 n=1 Tax=Asterias rubens TaxID=7604 RepID=UPI0014559733|nr:putative cytochrome P450 120 [Asterias rubens]